MQQRSHVSKGSRQQSLPSNDTKKLPIENYHQDSRFSSVASTTASTSKPNRIVIFVKNHIRPVCSKDTPRWVLLSVVLGSTLAVTLIAYIGFWVYHHYQCYAREANIVWHEGPSHYGYLQTTSNGRIDLQRTCPSPDYPTLLSTSTTIPPESICITSLTDTQSPSWWQRMIRCRDFDSLATSIAFPNFRNYAKKHGYRFVDSSSLIDTSRPPAWSKILAVQALLSDPHHPCEWVWWLDADIVIMNSNIRLESLLPRVTSNDSPIDLIATFDRKFTVNSGSWLLRNSDWSKQFLHHWYYGYKNWVRRSGFSLSGDNAAFGNYVESLLRNPKESLHIRRPARCTLNSFGVFMTQTELDQITEGTLQLQDQPWYLSENFYHKGDFLVHASGIDQKITVLQEMVKRAE